ncbi:anti-sigma factor domain-containing protein [Glutamicibacter ardleyensis]|uniref:anti-sigma factor n=1 Tax=Glutamicibacter ardleyensis TaxID=225894 RepID=UPI003FCFF620
MDRQNHDGSLSTEDHELLTGLALEAFDSPEDRQRATELVNSNEQAAQWLRGYCETIARLDRATAMEPPTDLRDKIFAELPTQVSPAPISLSERREQKRRGMPRYGWLAAAAAAVVLAAVPSAIAVNQHQRAVTAEAQHNELLSVLDGQQVKVVNAQMPEGQGAMTLLASSSGTVVLGHDLPVMDQEHDYQLWTIAAGGTPVPSDVVPHGDWSTQLPALPEGTTIALTVEPAGGSQAPTTDPVMALVG